jgi:hypothetical protein
MSSDRTEAGVGGAETAREPARAVRRVYRSPVLTEYGSVDELVDAGVVGNGTVPSITPTRA